jgi:hypothetical protein
VFAIPNAPGYGRVNLGLVSAAAAPAEYAGAAAAFISGARGRGLSKRGPVYIKVDWTARGPQARPALNGARNHQIGLRPQIPRPGKILALAEKMG